MKTIEELNKRKAPIVRIDESLDKYDNIVLFPEKLAKANEILKISGLPLVKTEKRQLSKNKRCL